jgi:two-component system sensor histidine kinase MtrB
VRVVLDGDATDVTITVSDAGAGVPPELAPVVFDRFVRGDPARAAGAGTGTAGLGLAIAAENAALHGGSVTIAADRPNAFVVRLPRRLDHPDPPTRHPSTASHPRTALHPPTALSAPPARG